MMWRSPIGILSKYINVYAVTMLDWYVVSLRWYRGLILGCLTRCQPPFLLAVCCCEAVYGLHSHLSSLPTQRRWHSLKLSEGDNCCEGAKIVRRIWTNTKYSWFQNFAVSWMLHAFFWAIPRRLNFICRRFGTLCLFHLHRQVGAYRWNRQIVPKRRRIKFRRRGITQKKAYNKHKIFVALAKLQVISF